MAEHPSKPVVSLRLLEKLQRPPAEPGEADALARRALLYAHQHLTVLSLDNVQKEHVNATSTLVQAFDATAQFIQQHAGGTADVPACWLIVATAFSCVLGGIDPSTVEPYSAAGYAFTAFAGACLLLQSLNQLRESLLCVSENNLMTPTFTEDLVEDLEHTAFCDDCLQEQGPVHE